MRLSENVIAQLVDSEPPRVVLADTSGQEEVALDRQELLHLLQAAAYFSVPMDITREQITEALGRGHAAAQ